MKKLSFLKPAISLITVCVGIAALLAVVNFVTADRISENNQKEKQMALSEIFDELATIENIENNAFPKEITEVGIIKNGEGELVGRFVEVQATGFKGAITLIVGFDKSGKIADVVCLEASETPGIGTQATGKEYLIKYKQASAETVKAVDTVSGATISSKAIKSGIESACNVEKAIREAK